MPAGGAYLAVIAGRTGRVVAMAMALKVEVAVEVVVEVEVEVELQVKIEIEIEIEIENKVEYHFLNEIGHFFSESTQVGLFHVSMTERFQIRHE